MSKLLYFLFLPILVCNARSKLFSSEQSVNLTADTHASVKHRYLDGCIPGKVFLLTTDNFYDITAKGTFFVKFYEPDCMGCEDFESTWKDLAKSFKSKRSLCFAELDCENAKVVCNEYDLRYEPNLIWLENGDALHQYDGDLTFEGVSNFIKDMIRTNSTKNCSSENTHPISVSNYFKLVGWLLFVGSVSLNLN
ncbi:thioredoxin domain-containing protein 5 homolog [Drosophila biarmipes]|uniref:thioredoxin domain-containing protein 5 homolog n=1 Tax=Drosophila biarmipes TaxID=125945 RepID=UPI0007E75A59|nr:thioredoxin domain-containing protein 5 homolog [Drosophila biarmipes]